MYTPKPIDTSKISLPEELLQLTEKIAENIEYMQLREGEE